jgi:hypothetical protein
MVPIRIKLSRILFLLVAGDSLRSAQILDDHHEWAVNGF